LVDERVREQHAPTVFEHLDRPTMIATHQYDRRSVRSQAGDPTQMPLLIVPRQMPRREPP
jgi:hypothetical protein